MSKLKQFVPKHKILGRIRTIFGWVLIILLVNTAIVWVPFLVLLVSPPPSPDPPKIYVGKDARADCLKASVAMQNSDPSYLDEDDRLACQEAAKRGDTVATYMMYRYHRFEAEGFHWLQKSASQGSAKAMGDLGDAYLIGMGVQQNPDQGIRWLLAAAQLGDAHAFETLANAYFAGMNVKQDVEKAYRWSSLAAIAYGRLGTVTDYQSAAEAADMRDSLARLLSPD